MPDLSRVPPGACVLPGFVDTHTHLEWAAQDFWTVSWAEVTDRAEALRRLSTVAARIPVEHWVLGGDWLPSELAEPPYLGALDHVTGGRPLFLRSRCHSTAVLNSVALRHCGIDRDTDHPGIERDNDGEPTGVLRGPAVWSRLAAGVVPPRNTHRALAELRSVLADIAARGITEVHDIATRPVTDSALPKNVERSHTDLALIERLRDNGELPVRVGYRLPVSRVDDHETLTVGQDEQVFFAGYKVFLDDGWFTGGPRVDEFRYAGFAETSRQMRIADGHGAPVSVHAIGDLGVAEALDLIASLPNRRGTELPPHRLVHARVIRPADIARCAELGVVVETQPWEVTGYATEGLANPYASLLAAGVRVVFGTDRRLGMRQDLRDADPLTGIQVAVTRQWDGPVRQPGERIGVAAALRCATAGGEVVRPWRERPDDLVVLDTDPRTVPADEIAGIGVLATIRGGTVVHDREGIFT